MSKYDFSVAMCVYGGDDARDFSEALESVYEQTLVPNEVVLVVDGPVPNEINEVIEKYQAKKNFNVYRLAENMGHGPARQASIVNCKNEYIAIADADDINTKDRFELQIQMFKDNPGLSVISSNCYHFIDSIDNIISEEILPTTDDEIKDKMKTRCPICQASTMMKKSEVEKAGGYLDWFYAEDYYLWIRLMLQGATFANIPKSLLYVRTSEEQMMRRGGYKYFVSLEKLFRYMWQNNMINFPTYFYDVSARFVLQVLLPAKVRGFIRKKLM